jgi:chemosensory pili system protein ChpC
MSQQSRVLGNREMRGLLLPLGERNLLLPNVAVAELVGFQEPEAEADAEDWLLGSIAWRGRRIPVVSFTAALGGETLPAQGQRMRIAVLNTLNGNPELPYIGVLTLGISRLARVSADNLAPDPSGEVDSDLVLESLTVGDQPAWIPDLDRLETLLTGS